jgi:hypothetical protein
MAKRKSTKGHTTQWQIEKRQKGNTMIYKNTEI